MRHLRIIFFALAVNCSALAHAGDYEQKEVSFANGDITLAATILIPGGAGPHPGMVLIGGSGPTSRDDLREVATGFAQRNIAVLIYDKRGVGASEGNWITSALEDLAGDAVQAHRTLAAESQVDTARVGYWGISQGGWVAPIAANESGAAFAIVVTGGGLSPRQVEMHNYLAAARRVVGDFSAGAQVEELVGAYLDYLKGDSSRAELEHTLEQYRSEAWYESLGVEHVIPGESNRRNWAWVASYEPVQTISDLSAPVLVLLGESDPLTPSARTAIAWRNALAESTKNNQVLEIPDAGHGLRTGAHGGALIADYYALHTEWLTSIGMLSDDVAASPYAGQEVRKIKALSRKQINGYLEGRGLGYARAAELNHYPGPRHVLELAEELGLSADQIAHSRQIFEEMKARAMSSGRELVDRESQLDHHFASGTIDAKILQTLVSEIGALEANIRFAHLNAHLQQQSLLSEHQVREYDRLRGYRKTERE